MKSEEQENEALLADIEAAEQVYRDADNACQETRDLYADYLRRGSNVGVLTELRGKVLLAEAKREKSVRDVDAAIAARKTVLSAQVKSRIEKDTEKVVRRLQWEKRQSVSKEKRQIVSDVMAALERQQS